MSGAVTVPLLHILALDPLFSHGVHWVELLIVVVKVVVAFAALMISVMLMVWFERKLVSDMQARIGPNRAGPWGLLQTLADGIKLFFKEDLLPDRSDRFVFRLAAYLAIVPAFLAFAIVPVGGLVTIAGHRFELQVADPPIGILFLLAMSSVSVYGVMLAGWSSGSKYPLLGSVRASAQMISYEAALGMTVIVVILLTGSATNLVGSLSTRAIVDSQSHTFFASWNLIRTGIVPFVLFLVAITAELQRPPFDLAEADTELVGGFNTEYSSIRFAMFFMAEFMNVITMSAVIVTLFFGRPRRAHSARLHPFLADPGPLVPWQDLRLPLLLRVAPSRSAQAALRPAHEPRLEGTHTRLFGLGPRRGRGDRRAVVVHRGDRSAPAGGRALGPLAACGIDRGEVFAGIAVAPPDPPGTSPKVRPPLTSVPGTPVGSGSGPHGAGGAR